MLEVEIIESTGAQFGTDEFWGYMVNIVKLCQPSVGDVQLKCHRYEWRILCNNFISIT